MTLAKQNKKPYSATFLALQPWLVCFTASLFFFYELIQGNMFASIADNIMREFDIQADKMALLSSVYYFSNVLFLFVSGLLLDRFSAKKTLLVAMILSVVSTFILAYAHTLPVAFFCRFVAGIGSAFCFLGPVRIASRWFPPKRMAFVTGAIVTLGMSGGMLAQYPLAKLVLLLGWRDAVVYLGALGVAIFFMMFLGIKDKPSEKTRAPVTRVPFLLAAKQAYFNPQTFCAALYTSLMNIPVAVFGALMGSLYLMKRLGVDKADASMVNSMLFIGIIIGGPIMGWYSDRMGMRVWPMKMGALVSLGIILVILYCPMSLLSMTLLFLLLGFFSATQVIGYALVAESSSPTMTAMAVSLVSILTQGGYIVYQNIFGRLLLWHGEMKMVNGVPVYSLGDYQLATIVLPLGFILALLLLFMVKETHCRQIQG